MGTPKKQHMKRLKVFGSLVKDSLDTTTQGSKKYHIWMAFLTFVMLIGMYCYSLQIEHGLSVTGMTDRVSWDCIFLILHFLLVLLQLQ